MTAEGLAVAGWTVTGPVPSAFLWPRLVVYRVKVMPPLQAALSPLILTVLILAALRLRVTAPTPLIFPANVHVPELPLPASRVMPTLLFALSTISLVSVLEASWLRRVTLAVAPTGGLTMTFPLPAV